MPNNASEFATSVNNFDWNLAISLITLAIAIICPVITAICNNIHARKLKKLELKNIKEMEYYHLKTDAYKNYLNEISSQIHTTRMFNSYECAYRTLFLYVPSEYWNKIISLDSQLRLKNIEKRNELYTEVTKALAYLLQEQEKSIPV